MRDDEVAIREMIPLRGGSLQNSGRRMWVKSGPGWIEVDERLRRITPDTQKKSPPQLNETGQ